MLQTPWQICSRAEIFQQPIFQPTLSIFEHWSVPSGTCVLAGVLFTALSLSNKMWHLVQFRQFSHSKFDTIWSKLLLAQYFSVVISAGSLYSTKKKVITDDFTLMGSFKTWLWCELSTQRHLSFYSSAKYCRSIGQQSKCQNRYKTGIFWNQLDLLWKKSYSAGCTYHCRSVLKSI